MFYLNKNTDRDKDQLSCVLSAISIFADVISKSDYYSLETSKKKLTLKYCKNRQVIVVCITDISTKEKHVLNQLDIICRLIEGLFDTKDFFKFNGDVTIFEDLEIELKALDTIKLKLITA